MGNCFGITANIPSSTSLPLQPMQAAPAREVPRRVVAVVPSYCHCPTNTDGSPPRCEECFLTSSGMHPDAMSYTLVSTIARRFRILVVGKVRMGCYMCQSQVQADPCFHDRVALASHHSSTLSSDWICRCVSNHPSFVCLANQADCASRRERRDQNTCPEPPMSTPGLFHTTAAIS